MKLGNADGGKAATSLSPLIETHLLHTEVESMETKLLRIAELAIFKLCDLRKEIATFCE
jgi:hypothetical protein